MGRSSQAHRTEETKAAIPGDGRDHLRERLASGPSGSMHAEDSRLRRQDHTDDRDWVRAATGPFRQWKDAIQESFNGKKYEYLDEIQAKGPEFVNSLIEDERRRRDKQ